MNTITSSTSAQETKALSELFAQRANLQSNLQATPESSVESRLDSSKAAEIATSKPESTSAVQEKFGMQSFLNALAPNEKASESSELARAQAAQGVGGVAGFDERLGKDPYDSLHKIEDTFTPSKELSAAMNAKSYVKHGLADVDSFKLMARQLQADGVLNRDDMMAVDFLSAKSPNISLQDFDAMIKNDNLSREMRGLISQLVQKLHMVNYISGGLMSA